MELWDVLDDRDRPIGVCEKGKLPAGCYHAVSHVWTMDDSGRFLLSLRAPQKRFGGLWETTGGAALAGETAEQAARRELFEELGLSCPVRFLFPYRSETESISVFLARYAGEPIRLRPGETVDFRFASADELRAMRRSGTCMPFTYEEALFSLLFGDSTDG